MENLLRMGIREAVRSLWGTNVSDDLLQIQKTRREFAGDLTLVVFPLTRVSRCSPEQTAGEIGEYLSVHLDAISGYNVIKGFLNLSIAPAEWAKRTQEMASSTRYGFTHPGEGEATVVNEY